MDVTAIATSLGIEDDLVIVDLSTKDADKGAEDDHDHDHDHEDKEGAEGGKGEGKGEEKATAEGEGKLDVVAAAQVVLDVAKEAVEDAGCNDATEADARERREAHGVDACVALLAALQTAESALATAQDVIGDTSSAATVAANLVAVIAVIGGAVF